MSLIKKTFRKVGYVYNNYTNFDEATFIELKPKGKSIGNALISYIAEPFQLKNGERVPNTHTHFWESLEMANALLKNNYAVDVISYRSQTFVPKKKYAIFMGARTNFERIAKRLNPDCIKIAHMDMSHWLFNNSAAIKRCLDLQQRRGFTLRSYKLQEENWAVEHADHITILGNKFTEDTYIYSGKPIHRLPIPACTMYPKPEGKDYGACKKNFLWFGSRGLVHKGLDLVIDAFRDLPDYNLTICGPISNDKDIKFEKLYYKELYETPNIRTVGWVDVESEEFKKITDNCVSIIYPSAAEGGGGCVITAMHAGLIPIVSYEASVDVEESFGTILRDNTVQQIQQSVKELSAQSNDKLRKMSHTAWEVARERYTRAEYTKALDKLIGILVQELKN